MKKCLLMNLDTVEYGKAWELQKNLFSARSLNKINDVLILTQHPPTFTIGRRGDTNQLLFSEEELMRRGYSIYEADRGGAITYHGPGQIVGYPILNMKSYTEDYYEYLRMLEEVMIRTLNELGIHAGRRAGFTGVWVNGNSNAECGVRNGEWKNFFKFRTPHSALRTIQKIGSIGVRIVMGYTMHGFSLNVNNDLSPFGMIIPCNIPDVKMTSISQILGARERHGRQRTLCPLNQRGKTSLSTSSYQEVKKIVVKQFANVFGVKIQKWKNGLTGLELNYLPEMLTVQ